MPALTLSNFSGARPKIAPRSLPDGFAQQADNCDLETGQLRARRGNAHVCDLPHALVVRSIYKFDDNWLAWAEDVDVVLSPLDTDKIFYSGDGFPKQATLALATSGTPDSYPTDYRRLGVLPPDSVLTVSITGDDSGDIVRSVAYIYTMVTTDGEESEPSDPTAVFDVHEGQTVSLGNFSYQAGSFNNYQYFRIYRLNVGTSGAEYQYVADLAISSSSYDDTKADSELGEVLPTQGWDAPVGTLKGLGQFVQGIMVGFSGKDLYFFEPWIPYAAPAKYSISVNEEIVGWGYYDETIVVLSEDRPYLVIGADPQSMSMYPMPYDIACASKRSIANTPKGVVFSAQEGLFLINSSGSPVKLTQNIYTEKQWEDLNPSTVLTAWYNGKLYVFWQGTQKGLVLDLNWDYSIGLDLDKSVYGLHVNSSEDLLYLLLYDDTDGYQVYSLNQGSLGAYTYKTREILTRSLSFSVAQVYADYDTEGRSATLKLYADNTLIHTQNLSDSDQFRLPAKGSAYCFTLLLEGDLDIDAISLATTPRELMT